MKVRVGVCHISVAEGNCVVVRRGGEQPEANWQSAGYHCRTLPDDSRLVWLFQACRPMDISTFRWIYSSSIESDIAQAGKATWNREMLCRSQMLAKYVLRGTRAVHHGRSPNVSEPTPMRKPLTGEPYAGEPHVRFGVRGGESLLYPYQNRINQRFPKFRACGQAGIRRLV